MCVPHVYSPSILPDIKSGSVSFYIRLKDSFAVIRFKHIDFHTNEPSMALPDFFMATDDVVNASWSAQVELAEAVHGAYIQKAQDPSDSWLISYDDIKSEFAMYSYPRFYGNLDYINARINLIKKYGLPFTESVKLTTTQMSSNCYRECRMWSIK